MTSFRTFQNKIQRGQIASLGVLLVAISALLVAPSASAESVAASASAVATESPLPAVQAETSDPATEPVETQQAAGVVDSVADSAVPVAESSAAPSPRENPASPAPVDDVLSSASATADSVTTAATTVKVTTGVEPDIAVMPSPQHRVPQLVEDIGQGSAPTTGVLRRAAAESVAPAIERLSAVQVSPVMQPGDAVGSVTPVAQTMFGGSMPAAGEHQGWAPRFLPPPSAGSFSLQGTIAAGLFVAGQLADLGGLKVEGIQALNSSGAMEQSLSPRSGPTAAFTGSNTGHFGSPAPPDVPLPVPGSPATSTSGTGGSSSFVPIAALLALLALVAPAALRRLGRAVDFRAPTQFVCALERPG